MTDKERLEEIKKLRETILEENDFRTRCVLAYVFVGLGYMDYLIKQAERVQELEGEVFELKARLEGAHKYNDAMKMIADDYEKQNKRYSEALLDVRETLNTSLSMDVESYESVEIIDKVLEGEE